MMLVSPATSWHFFGKQTSSSAHWVWALQVILDEFEKLEYEALVGFLEAWDSGRWVDTSTKPGDKLQTRTVDCSKTIFILTTNIKLEAVDKKKRHMLKQKLPFPNELTGRMTEVFVYPRWASILEYLLLHLLDALVECIFECTNTVLFLKFHHASVW
jgi:hypothetical protein